MKRSDFRFTERLRVRWSEIDAQQIVFNGHYLAYFDTAVGGYWRTLAMPYAQTMARLGGDLFVRKASVEYFASARYDDLLDVGMRCARIGNSSLVFEGGVFCQDRLLVSGELIYVFADPASRTAQRVPEPLRSLLEAFEARESMIDLRVGSWEDLQLHARALRGEVFVRELGIPEELEWDAADVDAVHAVALNRFGQPVATGRLLQDAPRVGRIGRMASAQPVRGSGVGRAVLAALLQFAKARGDNEVVLSAQASAVGFYERAGFRALGAVYPVAGIDHVDMTRAP